MTLGVSADPVGNAMLDLFGTLWTPYVKLHLGDPGAAGTANPCAETTRKALTFAAATVGLKAATGNPVAQWPSWSAGLSIITHVSLWSAPTGGLFLISGALGSAKTADNADTFNLTAATLAVITLAGG